MSQLTIKCGLATLLFCCVLNIDATVAVKFVEPEKFKDLSLSGSTSEKTQQYLTQQIAEYLQKLGETKLPKEQTLQITITDIDMAGEYEPWRSPYLTNSRFIRDVYRPQFRLNYLLTDAVGQNLQERAEIVVDINYLQLADPSYTANDPLRYEKALLKKWFNQRFVEKKTP